MVLTRSVGGDGLGKKNIQGPVSPGKIVVVCAKVEWATDKEKWLPRKRLNEDGA